MDLTQHNTNRIIEIISKAKENMPKEATHLSIYNGSRCSTNELGGLVRYSGTDCSYYNDNEKFFESKYCKPLFLGYEKVGDFEIDNYGDWQDTYCANYVLYKEGLYRPHNNEELDSIKGRYDTMLNYGLIYPINEIYSDEYTFKMIAKDIIKNHTDSEVKLVFIQDYEYCECRWEKYLKGKKEYAVRGRIVCDDLDFTSECESETKIWILFDHIRTELNAHGVENVSIEYDMDDVDKNRIEGHHDWGGLRWDKFDL